MAKKQEPKNVLSITTMEDKPAPTVWREVTESNVLKCILSPKEREEYTQELARSIHEIASLEEDKKASASRYKAEIEEKSARQNRLSVLIQNGWDERPVKCRWVFECSGYDDHGRPIFHPEMKTLVREDTGEVVKSTQMTEHDFNSHKELALENEGGENAKEEEEGFDGDDS